MDELTRARTQLNAVLDTAIERDVLAALRAVGAIEGDLTERQRRAVRIASIEHSWAEIGDALGVSRQAAHQKFAKEWANVVKSEVNAKSRALAAARRSGDDDAAAAAERSRKELVAEIKSVAKAQRRRARRGA
jgi:hypothetical protein